MIFWNYDNPITLFACLIWNISEWTGISLGKIEPIILSLAIGTKGNKQLKHKK